MNLLTYDQILNVHEKALEAGLQDKRALLLGGLAKAFTAALPLQFDPSSQMLSDLHALNSAGKIVGDVVPLELWLRTASYLTAVFPDKQAFFREMSNAAAEKIAPAPAEKASNGNDEATIEERVIYVNDMVPFGFLEGARRTGNSVARMIVPRFEGGMPGNYPFSAEQIRYYGTGWLIGARHIITNHHVINARNPGELAASETDFALQGEAAIVQFDYDADASAGVTEKVGKMALANKDMDFAILEIVNESARRPLPLWGGKFELPPNSYVPVNVIQHPGGAAKQMAIRNNLIARLDDKNIAYFTDTEAGSSGSPVCSDTWEVVALHKASTRALGNFEFQGKTTAWVNVGTRIDRLIDFLKDNHADLWQQIAADVRS